jgi:hypothetical protein
MLRRGAVLTVRAALVGSVVLAAVACDDAAARRNDCEKPGVCFPGQTPPITPPPTPTTT